jgi:TolA-binding protein
MAKRNQQFQPNRLAQRIQKQNPDGVPQEEIVTNEVPAADDADLDPIVDVTEVRHQASDFLARSGKLIGLVVGGLALLVGGYLAYKYLVQAPKQQQAAEQMFPAEMRFQQDSFALALTNPKAGFSGFMDVASQYSGTDAGNLAKYYAGISYLQSGQFDAAVRELEAFTPKGDVLPIVRNGALGDAYSELKNFDKALEFYKKAAGASENDALSPFFVKKAGMMSEKQGQIAEANRYYKLLKDRFPTSPEGRDAEKYILRTTK